MALLRLETFRQFADGTNLRGGFYGYADSDQWTVKADADFHYAKAFPGTGVNSDSNIVLKDLPPLGGSGTLIFGFRMWVGYEVSGGRGLEFIARDSNNNTLFRIDVPTGSNDHRKRIVEDSLGVELAGSAFNVRAKNWTFVEFKINASSVTVRVDGVVVANSVPGTFSGVVENIIVWVDGWSSDYRFTDLYWMDDTGPAPFNDFLGLFRSSSLLPTGDDAVSWTPLSGVDNYAMVDEATQDGDTTYNTAVGFSGDVDKYTFPSTTLRGVEQPIGVYMQSVAKRDASGAADITHVMNAQEGVPFSVAESWVYPYDFFPTSDGSTPWNITSINSMKAGVKAV